MYICVCMCMYLYKFLNGEMRFVVMGGMYDDGDGMRMGMGMDMEMNGNEMRSEGK